MLTKSPKSFLHQGAMVFIDRDNCSDRVETLSPRFHWWSLRSVPRQSRLQIPQDNPCSREVISLMRCSLKQQTKGLTELCPVQTNPFLACLPCSEVCNPCLCQRQVQSKFSFTRPVILSSFHTLCGKLIHLLPSHNLQLSFSLFIRIHWWQ